MHHLPSPERLRQKLRDALGLSDGGRNERWTYTELLKETRDMVENSARATSDAAAQWEAYHAFNVVENGTAPTEDLHEWVRDNYNQATADRVFPLN